jgi:hypothetical protein
MNPISGPAGSGLAAGPLTAVRHQQQDSTAALSAQRSDAEADEDATGPDVGGAKRKTPSELVALQ